jgi:tRNA G18 (ribose-2'-O)-methylase SpoU
VPVYHVASATDLRLAAYCDMGDAARLRDHDLFVAEGRFVVERVLANPGLEVVSLMLNRASLVALQPALAASTDLPIYECPTAVFREVTGFNLHRGCLALVRRPPARRWRDVVADARIVVVLEAVADADNVGSVFRNAAAFGVGAVLLSPTSCDPLYRKAVRTSMGFALSVPFATVEPWPAALAQLAALGFNIVALSPRHPSTTLDDFAATPEAAERIALLVGTEGAGLSDEAERLARRRLRIPLAPPVDSLNLAVATGIALARLSPR